MKNQKGKINLSTILIIIVLAYGGFVAFKLISSRVTKSQIKNEIIEQFGFIRGTDFSGEKGEQIIIKILEEHDLYKQELPSLGEQDEDEDEDEAAEETNKEYYEPKIYCELKGNKITFSVEYIDTVNLLLFKLREKYFFEHEMLNYN